jgi:CRP-like cAMP-binding protein
MNVLKFLSETSPFNALAPDALRDLAELGQVRAVPKGARVYAEGEHAGLTYVVMTGQVQITRAASDGKPLTIEILKAGEMFGCVGCAAMGNYPCEAVAGAASDILLFPMSHIRNLLEKNLAFGRALFYDMSRRMREAQSFRTLGAETVEKRIAGVLLWLAGKFGSDLPFTRQSIAEMANTTPESAIRTLIDFRRRGLIATGWKRIAMRNSKALRELLEGVAA